MLVGQWIVTMTPLLRRVYPSNHEYFVVFLNLSRCFSVPPNTILMRTSKAMMTKVEQERW